MRMVRPPEPEDLPVEPDFFPLEGLLTLCGLAVVPLPVPADLPGSSGLRMARGPVEFAGPPVAVPGRLMRRSEVSPDPPPLFRRRTRPPSIGCTEIFVPAGLRVRLLLVRLILLMLLSASPLRAFRAMCGSRS